MMEFTPFLLVIGGYLLGGVMPSELAFRIKFGKQAFETGEKPGTFSVFRKIGFIPALLVLIFDAGKGFLPIWLAFQWNVNLNWLPLIATAPAAGHSWPFLRWKYGGWALAAACGAIWALSGWVAWIGLGVGIISARIFRKNPGPALATAGIPVVLALMIWQGEPWQSVLAVIAAAGVVFLRRLTGERNSPEVKNKQL